MGRIHQAAVLTEIEWEVIETAYAGSSFRSAVDLLKKADNAPQTAADLFGLERSNQGEESANAIFRSIGLPYRFAQSQARSAPSRAYRMFSVVRWAAPALGRLSKMSHSRVAEIAILLQQQRHLEMGTIPYMLELLIAAEALRIPEDEMHEFYTAILDRLMQSKTG